MSDECRVERVEKNMKRKFTVLTLCAMLFALCVSAQAQQPKKVPLIGFLVPGSSASYSVRIEAFRQGLRDLGYVDGENIIIEGRWAEGSAERLSHLIDDLILLKLDVLVVGSTGGARAAKNAGVATPVVFVAVTDPIGYG